VSIAAYEGVIENGEIRLLTKASLVEGSTVYIIVPDMQSSLRSVTQPKQIALSASKLQLYSDKTFELFRLRSELSRDEQSNLENALQLAKNFAEQPQDFLMFTGGHGSGKTHLAAAIANYQAKLSHPVMFVVVPDLLDYLRSAFDSAAQTSFDRRFDEIRSTPLLVLDDLGAEAATPWAREKLYQIINHRYVAHLPTVITTSVSPDDLDPRILERIRDEKHCLVFPLSVLSYLSGSASKEQKNLRSHSVRRR
jgi:DNA replication protein DnaC